MSISSSQQARRIWILGRNQIGSHEISDPSCFRRPLGFHNLGILLGSLPLIPDVDCSQHIQWVSERVHQQAKPADTDAETAKREAVNE